MHLKKISYGIIQIIVFIVYSDFTAIWDILAEFFLKNQFFTACSLFINSTVGLQRCVIISTQVIDGTEHTVIKKSQT